MSASGEGGAGSGTVEPPEGAGGRLAGWLSMTVLLTSIVLFPLFVDRYLMHLAILSAIAVIATSSLNLVTGYAGILSLGHAAFYGIGAYTSALLCVSAGWPVPIAMLASVPVSALAALLIGPIVLRLRGAYFIIATLSFSIVLQLVITNWVGLTQGPMGILGIPVPALAGFELGSKTSYYYLVAGCAGVTVWLIARLVDSRVGRAFIALREHDRVATSIGVDHRQYALTAFVIAAAFAGLAGALYAHYVSVITPDILGFDIMVSMLVMMVVGGKGTLWGPVIGAVLVTFVPEQLRLAKEWRLSIFGCALMLCVVLLPNGIASLVPLARQLLRRWRGQ